MLIYSILQLLYQLEWYSSKALDIIIGQFCSDTTFCGLAPNVVSIWVVVYKRIVKNEFGVHGQMYIHALVVMLKIQSNHKVKQQSTYSILKVQRDIPCHCLVHAVFDILPYNRNVLVVQCKRAAVAWSNSNRTLLLVMKFVHAFYQYLGLPVSNTV